jgi:hypothetical protein
MSEQAQPAASVVLPGRLRDPGMFLATDPRSDPRMLAAMRPLGMDQPAPALPIGPDAPLEQVLELIAVAEESNTAAFAALLNGLAPVEGVTTETQVIDGEAGNEVTLFIHRPAEGPARKAAADVRREARD